MTAAQIKLLAQMIVKGQAAIIKRGDKLVPVSKI